MFFYPNSTVAFTGRRTYRGQADDLMQHVVGQLAGRGFRTFLCGMAMGFDLAAAECVLRVAGRYRDVELVAVVPFTGQAERYPAADRERYEQIIREADGVVTLSQEYTPHCYAVRNDFLTDHASVLVAWYDGRKNGGTHYTVTRARRRGMEVINLWPDEQRELDFGASQLLEQANDV